MFHFYTPQNIFGSAGKWLDEKAEVNFGIYDITNWNKNNYSPYKMV